jgi:hypothetical protein
MSELAFASFAMKARASATVAASLEAEIVGLMTPRLIRSRVSVPSET